MRNYYFLSRTQWIYDASDVIYPSVYMTEQIHPNDRAKMVRGRVRESIRLSRRARGPQKPKVIAYFRYVFTDTKKFLNEVRYRSSSSSKFQIPVTGFLTLILILSTERYI